MPWYSHAKHVFKSASFLLLTITIKTTRRTSAGWALDGPATATTATIIYICDILYFMPIKHKVDQDIQNLHAEVSVDIIISRCVHIFLPLLVHSGWLVKQSAMEHFRYVSSCNSNHVHVVTSEAKMFPEVAEKRLAK